jgi:hypothetical protein
MYCIVRLGRIYLCDAMLQLYAIVVVGLLAEKVAKDLAGFLVSKPDG